MHCVLGLAFVYVHLLIGFCLALLLINTSPCSCVHVRPCHSWFMCSYSQSAPLLVHVFLLVNASLLILGPFFYFMQMWES
jgi:ABC-type arginine/histidine transport system permease subunit